ncbi:TauD/TfdA family dioxygenase [Porticoccaceae bacterium LTM1]|nr:TauD/TfdA family dioxygenase [Porticoccaceae bacterium LTM1]
MTTTLLMKKMSTPLIEIRNALRSDGWILLRDEDYSLESFSELMLALCKKLTFDPARQYASRQTQSVDAGTVAVGLHIENGNTPLPPDVVAFHSALSASRGGRTTVCDGAVVYQGVPKDLQEKFTQSMTSSRYLPKALWQRYVANAFDVDDPEQVTRSDLDRLLNAIPGQQAEDADDGGVIYQMRFDPVRNDNLSNIPAFANAILGPSYNYQTPEYRFSDGTILTKDLIQEVAELCEKFTQEIAWQNGDVAIIDNKRVMHGRREILVPLSERKLYIGMGLGLND